MREWGVGSGEWGGDQYKDQKKKKRTLGWISEGCECVNECALSEVGVPWAKELKQNRPNGAKK